MHLLCIDFSNLVIRHASNPYNSAVDQANRPVGGAVGSLSQVLRLIDELDPTHLIIAKDGSRSESFRRQIDPNYKAHREKADDDLLHHFTVAYRGVELLELPVLARQGYEADDVIASASRSFSGQTTIVSGDKDLLALCSEQVCVRLLRPGGHLDCRGDECEELIGVRPERVRDYKALVGDPSDGISGVTGIGHKTALQLLDAYGSLGALLEAIRDGHEVEGVKPGMAKKMAAGVEQAELSYQLAGLVEDLDLSELMDCTCPSLPQDSEIGEQLSEAGLHDLRRHLPGAKREELDKDKPLDFAAAFEQALRSSN